MSVPWGGMGVPGGMGIPGGMGVPGGWVFQGDECSRGVSVLGDGCLGGWEFHNFPQNWLIVICLWENVLQYNYMYCSTFFQKQTLLISLGAPVLVLSINGINCKTKGTCLHVLFELFN